jgi:hypothetical protein
LHSTFSELCCQLLPCYTASHGPAPSVSFECFWPSKLLLLRSSKRKELPYRNSTAASQLVSYGSVADERTELSCLYVRARFSSRQIGGHVLDQYVHNFPGTYMPAPNSRRDWHRVFKTFGNMFFGKSENVYYREKHFLGLSLTMINLAWRNAFLPHVETGNAVDGHILG